MSDQNQPSSLPLQTLHQQCLKSYPQYVECECSKSGATEVINRINIVSAVTCYCFGCCWMLVQIHKKRDLNCWDADHKCRTCGKILFEYKSC